MFSDVLSFKNAVDKVFFDNEIPLELDLENDNWYEYGDDFDPFGNENSISDYATHQILKDFGFKDNFLFPIPEPSAYGLTLAIVKDIDQSLTL